MSEIVLLRIVAGIASHNLLRREQGTVHEHDWERLAAALADYEEFTLDGVVSPKVIHDPDVSDDLLADDSPIRDEMMAILMPPSYDASQRGEHGLLICGHGPDECRWVAIDMRRMDCDKAHGTYVSGRKAKMG